ncbi:MAG: UvrD-helicase domain-containing protein, partial [Bacteroidales bacterium]|nr:UvrD-helicase domain-containing protein [Bacteroidales bacterium]
MKLNIYKASAGSGKTHILAGNYIVESFNRVAPTRSNTPLYDAFKDTMAFARILAVTFTNKAAGEMKERIIKELDKLAADEKSDYVQDICNRYPQYTAEQVSQRARSIRSAILHNYSDFNLRTIDSFVQSIVRAFCYDININSGYSTETDQKAVLANLIDVLLQKSDNDAELHEQFRAMAAKNVKDGANWDFRNQLTSLANLIFTEQFQTLENFYCGMDEETKRTYFAKSLEIINLIYDDFVEKADAISEKTKQIFEALPVTPAEIGRNINTLYNFLVSGVKECEIKTTISKLCDGDGWTNAKPTKTQQEYVPNLRTQIEPLLHEAVALVENDGINYQTANIIRRDFHAFMLLGDLARLMPEYRKENRMMLVSDATTFLNAIIANNDAPFIYERVGNRFDHIYIDEFQDTSEFQWNNFRPLIENTLAQGFDNMIVGDVKQAIYRFRGGDWSLLNAKVQEQIGADSINLNTLDVNWRSRKNIVDFNDAIFKKAIATLTAHSEGEIDFSLLDKIYADAYQKLPKNRDRSGGKVDVVFIEGKKKKNKSTKNDAPDSENADDEEAYDPLEGLLLPDDRNDNIFIVKSLNRMAQEIDSLIKQGISPKKIAILVRKGWQARLSVNFLMKYQSEIEDAAHYDVVSSDSLYIANSLIVKILINAMKYVNNPADIIAKIEMMRTYCIVSGKEIDDDGIFKAAADEDLPKDLLPEGFNEIIKSYSDLPLYDLCEKIISCFSLQQYTGDSEYLRTFEDCVLNFTKTFSSDLNRFVTWWDESGSSTAIQPSDEQDAVTIMTIHKSKGLDFSIQFVPFCNWEMEECNNMQDNYIWVQCPQDSPFASLPVLPV